MRIAIIDDEPAWLSKEQKILENFFEKEGLKTEFFSYTRLADIPSEGELYDLAFVDIEMAGEDGISFVRDLNSAQKHCQVIFVTNYLNYASDVYETEHIYFVLKDQFQDRLPVIFEKIRKKRSMGNSLVRLSVIHEGYVSLPAEDILYFERKLRKTIVKTAGREYEVFESLDELGRELDRLLFVRCHKSYMISLGQISRMTQTDFWLKNGDKVPISRRFYSAAKKQFLEWSGLQI